MTHCKFDAPASITPRASARQYRDSRPLVRIAWLVARFVGRRPVRFELYDERFGRSLRTFHRDIAALRDAGLYVDANFHGDYRLICFRPERDAA